MITFETGATSFAINDLILFTDNTKELSELRDNIYKTWIKEEHTYKSRRTLSDRMQDLLIKAMAQYKKKFPHDHLHIANIKTIDGNEYCNLYAADFENWKIENPIK